MVVPEVIVRGLNESFCHRKHTLQTLAVIIYYCCCSQYYSFCCSCFCSPTTPFPPHMNAGAHMNAAVTFTSCALGRMPWKKFPAYVLGQFLGSFLAAATTYMLFYSEYFPLCYLPPASVSSSEIWADQILVSWSVKTCKRENPWRHSLEELLNLYTISSLLGLHRGLARSLFPQRPSSTSQMES
jgi:hypothetical protein